MKLEEKHKLDLSKIVNEISKIQSVAGIFLFGSLVRGDYNEYSDYDLLVIFEDKTSMWRNWDELFQSVSNLKMNLHVIPQTLEELKTANPVFLDELFKHGKVLYARLPLEVFPKPLKLKPFHLIFYDMSSLSYKDKMKVSYLLYKKRGGTVSEMGGIKLSESCIMVPSTVGDEIIDRLRALGVNVKKMEIYSRSLSVASSQA